ncbi:ABC1 kinase family protein [Peptostreptococcus canis]|uniref:AarF/ABC1/UbiB kinase family protein n=1 Tax=Peptostreptococcus canis TaxID=1159213 RepID=A0ABR6TL74_9FIRM|nr:AarF/UbiB family protein [Peptostreptococcus canis]MBC2575949.1 AarF/ABC1/UbiB kinase family protein [Peptostreptococcus canis]MBP1997929.1 ubiquinone biosynthesis protein [Peptostreptococcus canis]
MRVSYKHLSRYKEIATVLVKYGFGFIVDKLNKDSVAGKVITKSPNSSIKSMTTGQRLRHAFEELGPTYIKIGQIISTRKDLFDNDIIEELSQLRDNVEPFDNSVAMDILKEELACEIEEVFEYISEQPIAAASIGQVYGARLTNGKNAVIKIQRPGIENIIKSDIDILKRLAGNLDFFKKDWNIDAKELISEMEVQLIRELDYKFEAVNGIKLGEIFKESREVFIPEIYNDYTTKRLLVMEKVDGICLSEIDDYNIDDAQKKRIIDIGVKSFFRQVMTCGFFHADPHPGNIFILDDGKLAYVDFGMIGLIDEKTLRYLNQLIISSTNKNTDQIIRILTDMNAISGDINNEILRRDLLYLIHYYYDIPLDKLSIAEILDEVFRFMRNHKIVLPSQLVLLGKTVITLEGTSRGLYKDFSVESIANAYLKYYREEKLDIKRSMGNLKANIDEYYYDFITVPGQIKGILNILEKNNLKLDIGEFEAPTLEESLRKFTTQVSMSITLAACIVGSSLILASSNIEKSRTIKYVSIAGFIISFIIGITLVFLMLKNNFNKGK